MQTTPGSGQVFTRIVVPLVLFLVVVAGVAVLVQNVHNRDVKNDTVVSSLLKFAYETAIPDRGKVDLDKDYVPEYEPGQPGQHDFRFENASNQEVEIGLDAASCNCNDVAIAVYQAGTPESALTFTSFKRAGRAVEIVDKKGEKQAEADVVAIPVGSNGSVRMSWKGKNEYGKSSFTAKVWVQPKGKQQSRQHHSLTAWVKTVPPLQFLPPKLEFGSFRDKDAKTTVCWSSTRDINAVTDDKAPSLQIDTTSYPPSFDVTLARLSDKEVADFQKELTDNKIASLVKSAVRIEVKVYEKIEGKGADKKTDYMDQGHFSVQIAMLLNVLLWKDGKDIPLPDRKLYPGPVVSGYVQSNIIVIPFDDGRIHLGTFERPTGFRRPTPFEVRADYKDTMLTVIDWPTNVKVKLEAKEEDGRRRWRLFVEVPPNIDHFPPVDKNAIVLRSQPTHLYLYNIAATLGQTGGTSGSVPIGSLPEVANFSNMITSWGFNTRRINIPVLGTLSR